MRETLRAASLPRATAIVVLFGLGCATQPIRPSAPAAQPQDTSIKIGQKFSIESKILKERRPYWVHLPESYTNQTFAPKRYPVLYLLDGDANFHWTSGVVQFMGGPVNANIQVPELIVVAIPNTQRTRDLTPTRAQTGTRGQKLPNLASSGGGETFLDFIRDELIPQHRRTSRDTHRANILVCYKAARWREGTKQKLRQAIGA